MKIRISEETHPKLFIRVFKSIAKKYFRKTAKAKTVIKKLTEGKQLTATEQRWVKEFLKEGTAPVKIRADNSGAMEALNAIKKKVSNQ